MEQLPNYALIIVVSYLLGAIPTAYIIARLNNYDIFAVGSGNMGATNISRILGIRWGLVVWFLDSLKGVSAVLLSRQILDDNRALATTLSAVVAILGHNWSIYVSFFTGSLRGGKGAATAFGTLLMVAPAQVVLVAFAISGAIVARTRYMSLGVLVMFVLSTVWIAVLSLQGLIEPVFIAYALATALLILYRFRDNIQRLIAGTERRLGEGT